MDSVDKSAFYIGFHVIFLHDQMQCNLLPWRLENKLKCFKINENFHFQCPPKLEKLDVQIPETQLFKSLNTSKKCINLHIVQVPSFVLLPVPRPKNFPECNPISAPGHKIFFWSEFRSTPEYVCTVYEIFLKFWRALRLTAFHPNWKAIQRNYPKKWKISDYPETFQLQ